MELRSEEGEELQGKTREDWGLQGRGRGCKEGGGGDQ
jgi:hypothetical protein